MFQVTSLSVAILILHCVFCSEVKREKREASRCVTSYERVEQVVLTMREGITMVRRITEQATSS